MSRNRRNLHPLDPEYEPPCEPDGDFDEPPEPEPGDGPDDYNGTHRDPL